MIYKKVVVKRVVSPDGRSVAEARSVVVTSSNDNNKSEHEAEDATNTVHQTVTVRVSAQGVQSSGYSSSSCSSHSS